MKSNDMIVSHLSFEDAANAMKAGELDAFFVTAAAPAKAISELAKSMKIDILSLDERGG